MLKFAIVNYGVGNLRNVKRGFENLGVNASITNDQKEILESDAIIFPGVGAFAEAMKNLSPIKNELKETITAGKPVFGICLGLQLLFTKSHEGGVSYGLGLVKGEITKILANVKLPHIGWNTIEIARKNPIVEGIPNNSFMYFVHTYIPKPTQEEVTVAETEYGTRFPSIIAKKNVFATQFHPEKSGKTGLKILENFVKIVKR
ncbi:MAG: imidazole glycerol phosphate synthase subunit HisH [Candidatus Bathyarchaeota archaeon]|nr:MAG: imidazole glycerol phosphate synthase subunit HisH [Candidatus Bathyarchaeota archaeon]